jgi:hypothetical protein
MLKEFHAEEGAGNPYRSPRLSPAGLLAFPGAMAEAILHGDEETLVQALSSPEYWNPTELYTRSGVTRERVINPAKAAEFLAWTEFNTWYVRGLARRLLDEGEELCQVYRAAPAWQPRAECLQHDGQIYRLQEIYDGHRARYWPPPGDPTPCRFLLAQTVITAFAVCVTNLRIPEKQLRAVE